MGIAKINSREVLFELLERKYHEYNRSSFIESDPVCIPHRFSKKQDIEIMGFWTAMLAWGNRKSIIASAERLIAFMEGSPHQFITQHKDKDLKPFLYFKHRTFNATDALYFIEFFKHCYQTHDSLEDAFMIEQKRNDVRNLEQSMVSFHNLFFSLKDAPMRTRKHIATPLRGSTCKRMNMFLRWMVRKDKHGVDFGIWKNIQPSQLYCPLDVHVDRVARRLGLIERKQTDWQTVIELTGNLKTFDPKDPVKYDFALFGMGVVEKAEMMMN